MKDTTFLFQGKAIKETCMSVLLIKECESARKKTPFFLQLYAHVYQLITHQESQKTKMMVLEQEADLLLSLSWFRDWQSHLLEKQHQDRGDMYSDHVVAIQETSETIATKNKQIASKQTSFRISSKNLSLQPNENHCCLSTTSTEMTLFIYFIHILPSNRKIF